MAEHIKPVGAMVWDRRTVSAIRRELEKGFDALKDAYEKANALGTKETRDEATRKANYFYDLFDARSREYANATIEASPQAEEAANCLVTDFSRYKETLERHYMTGKPAYIEGANVSFDGSVDGATPPDGLGARPEGTFVETPPEKAVTKTKTTELYKLTPECSILNKTMVEGRDARSKKPATATNVGQKTKAPRPTQASSLLSSMRMRVTSAVSAGKNALDNIVGGATPAKTLPPGTVVIPIPTTMTPPGRASTPPPPPPPPPTEQQQQEPTATATTTGAVEAVPRADAATAAANAEAAGSSADKNEDGSRPPLPAGFQAYEDEQREGAEANSQQKDAPKNPSGKETMNDKKSTTSSRKSSKKGSKGRSKASSILSEQIDREKDENLRLERTRKYENDAHSDAELAKLYSKIEKVNNQKKMDEKLYTKKVEHIMKAANELHAMVEEEEEEKGEEEEEEEREEEEEEEEEEIACDTSSIVTIESGSQRDDGFEMTAAGAALGGGDPDAMTSNWAKGAAKMTSTAIKDVKPPMPFELPRKNLTSVKRKSAKKLAFNATMTIEKKERLPYQLPRHKLEDVKPKEEMKHPEVKSEKGKKAKKVKQEVKADARSERSRNQKTAAKVERQPEAPNTSPTASSTSSATTEDDESSACSERPSTGVMESIFKLQQQQLEASLRQAALNQLKESRPKQKFSGAKGKKMDFEKHMKLFNDAMEIPGVRKKQMLNEFQHWFDGSAFKLIEAETLRSTEEAVDEALGKLTKKFGMRQDSALELLDEVLQGKTIGEEDPDGLLDFYARLTSIHALARETGRGSDFENKLVVKTIIEKKLPYIKAKWSRKAVKYKLTHKTEMDFAQFLAFLDEEHMFSEMMSRYTKGGNQGKSTANAKVSATSANAVTKKEGPPAPTKKATPGNCPRCDADHKLKDCPIYRELTPSDRRRFNKNQGLCFQCLEHGHMARTCESGIKCDKCELRHHPLVHPAPNGAKPPGGEAAEATPEERTA